MQIKDSKVLVTGAGGFIGSHLVEHLVRQAASVRAMIHYDSRPGFGNLDWLERDVLDEVEIIAGDICDQSFVYHAVEGCAAVFHLAALIGIPYSYVAPASYVATNISGTLNVLEACRHLGVEKVVHTSTSECYGTAQYCPIDEKHPIQGQSPYSASKIAADKLAESYWCSFDMPVATLRPFNNYGPRQSPRAVIPTIASQLLWGGPELRLGSLDPVRDFLFVADTCDAYVRIAESPEATGKTIHVGSGKKISVGELARLLMQRSGVEKPIIEEAARVRPEKSEVELLLCDPSLAEKVLGWTPKISFDEGLSQVIEFVKSHPEFHRNTGYAI